jgi:hypothetical protein
VVGTSGPALQRRGAPLTRRGDRGSAGQGYQRSGWTARESAVRQARQWPQVATGLWLLGSPHSGHSTVAAGAVVVACPAGSPVLELPDRSSGLTAWLVAMVRLLGVGDHGTGPHQPLGPIGVRPVPVSTGT